MRTRIWTLWLALVGGWMAALLLSSAQAQVALPKPIRLELPPGLASYINTGQDYLDQIDKLAYGSYAQWVDYPVPVYIQNDNAEWAIFVGQAVREWSSYIPLQVVTEPRKPREVGINIFRVKPIQGISGIAAPDLFFGPDGSLQQQVNIVISEYQGLAEVTTVARHELGHALGLWGHSPNPLDLMFGGNHAAAFGNRRLLSVTPIKPRDLNTIKRVYEQPTTMGLVYPEAFRRLNP